MPHSRLVYTNLICSMGHHEYIIPYHEQRKRAMASFGNGISKEIERIAHSKNELISTNIDRLKNSKNKKNYLNCPTTA